MNSLINVDQIKELKWCEYIITALKFTVLEWKRNPGHHTGPLVFVVLAYMDRVIPDSKYRRSRKFPIIAHWTTDDVNKRAAHERNGNGFGSGIIHEKPIDPTSNPEPITEQQQNVKELDLAERFQDIMINDMGPLLLKLGRFFEEAKSAGISSQSELAKLFFNYTKTINNMVVETAKAPDNVESQLDAWCNSEEMIECLKKFESFIEDALKSSKPANKQQEKGDDDVISSQPNWSIGLTQLEFEDTIKSTANQSKVVQPKANEPEGLNTVEKEILESVIQGAVTNYSTPQKVNDSTGDNTNQQIVSEEEIKEYIDRGKKQDQRKKRGELKITDKSPFWKNGGNGIKGITEIERLVSDYAFVDDNDMYKPFYDAKL
ncbi:OLC1v1024463C1 [Oldenlandia corymbosa var. corymbosa]|uniref:OLC1v1024463C1 n=1 Tax=Oldenlandia corymbosa var. corymbosa TaxID=529605 RepID=A0AAV1C3S6_OLDCO|nr:OLC1v1024463C1 [Oldenlandia corymbosa var. corymbosa]